MASAPPPERTSTRYVALMLLGLLAPLLLPGALAADSWNATCTAQDDPSVWFVLSAAPDAPPLPDFECKGLFFDSTISCTQTVGLGKIRPGATSPGGIAVLELRYLPYGDLPTIVGFLSQPGGGVLYKPPAGPVAATPAAVPPPLNSVELLKYYLEQRAKASAATKNITLHVWSCPDSGFIAPEEAITPYGMKLVEHVGKTPGP